MTVARTEFKSERHAALDAVYPPDKRYCACKQGRRQDCRCAYREDEPPVWLVRLVVYGSLAACAAGVYFGLITTP